VVHRYGSLREVDAAGAALAGGFVCHPLPGLLTCRTQRFAAGAVVRVKVDPSGVPTSLQPEWTGCDSVSSDRLTCTFTVAADGTTVSVRPAPVP
jgi:hypothetical protein